MGQGGRAGSSAAATTSRPAAFEGDKENVLPGTSAIIPPRRHAASPLTPGEAAAIARAEVQSSPAGALIVQQPRLVHTVYILGRARDAASWLSDARRR